MVQKLLESRKLPKAAHFGPFQKRGLRYTQTQHTLLNVLETLKCVCWRHPWVLGTAGLQGLNISSIYSGSFFSEWNLLGCTWFSQPLPWVSKVQFRLFPPEQLHGQGLHQLSRSSGGFEECRIHEVLLSLICLLRFGSVPWKELSCESNFSQCAILTVHLPHEFLWVHTTRLQLSPQLEDYWRESHSSSLDLRNLKSLRSLQLVTSVKHSGTEGWEAQRALRSQEIRK